MSWIFLAGDRVYKLKKPVRYPFLDFSTLSARAYFVGEEIKLNRRLAPDVYLGARSLTVGETGRLSLDEEGNVVDWLVEMRRLPAERMLDQLVELGELREADIDRVADVLAGFYHDLAPAEMEPKAYADRFLTEHRRTADTLQDERFSFDGPRLNRALQHFEREFDKVRGGLEERARRGRVVEGHGDLRPEHVCLVEPVAIIDCLEFNRGLRLVDPFDEIVFLGLECARMGADWVLPRLRSRLAGALGDEPTEEVLAFYWRYRALLRARLALLHLVEPVLRKRDKWRPLAWHYLEMAEDAESWIRKS